MADFWPCEMCTSQYRGWETVELVIRPTGCKTAHKRLLHCVIDLCYGPGIMRLLLLADSWTIRLK